MSTVPSSFDIAAALPAFPVRRFTVDEYHRMIETGVLTEADRVELLEGWIVPQMVRRPRHDATIELVEAMLRRSMPAGFRLRLHSAITTVDSEPEPDLALVQGEPRDHVNRHPVADEVGLVVEVADSSLERDRQKRRIYARAHILHYWIVNLVDGQIEMYSQPTADGKDASYAHEVIVHEDESHDVEIAGTTFRVDLKDLLP